MRQREFEVLREQLLNVRSSDVVRLLHLNDLQDVNGSEARPVTGSHILIHGFNSVAASHFAVLFVHVVGARAGVVAKPNPEILHLHRVLLMDLSKKTKARSQYASPS